VWGFRLSPLLEVSVLDGLYEADADRLDALERMCDSTLTNIRAAEAIMARSFTLDLSQRYQRLGAHLRTALPYPELDVGEEQMMVLVLDELDRIWVACGAGTVNRWQLPEQMDRYVGEAANGMRLCLLLIERRAWSVGFRAYRMGERPKQPQLARELAEYEVRLEDTRAANDRGFADHCRRTGYRPPGAEVVGWVVERLQPLAAS
jgi:hypothetical protein